MPTGPINCFGDASPVTRSRRVLRIWPAMSMLRWTLKPIASIGVGLERTRRLVHVMPMRTAIALLERRDRDGLIDAVAAHGEHDRFVRRFCEIASTTCDRNTMRWPLMARITSPGLRPEASAGSPGDNDSTLGYTSGSTPMVPTQTSRCCGSSTRSDRRESSDALRGRCGSRRRRPRARAGPPPPCRGVPTS